MHAYRPWSTIQRVTAAHWKDPASYRPEYTDLFPAVHSTEDPHVYTDADGCAESCAPPDFRFRARWRVLCWCAHPSPRTRGYRGVLF